MKSDICAGIAYLALTGNLFAQTSTPVDVEKAEKMSQIYYDIEKGQQAERDRQRTIDPKARAEDFVAAFKQMKAADPEGKFYVIVKGISISNLENFELMSNGTSVLLTIKTPTKKKVEVVRIEDIEKLGQW